MISDYASRDDGLLGISFPSRRLPNQDTAFLSRCGNASAGTDVELLQPFQRPRRTRIQGTVGDRSCTITPYSSPDCLAIAVKAVTGSASVVV